jgi:hypothetical protein
MNYFIDILIHFPIPEFILIMIGCLIIGFAISFLWINRKGGEEVVKIQLQKIEAEADQWRLKFYDLAELKEKELNELNIIIKELGQKEELQAVEIEELSLLNQQLMLKNKNASAQQSNLTQEIEILKNNIVQLETAFSQIQSENQSLQEKIALSSITPGETESIKLNSQIEELESNYLLLKAQLTDVKNQITKTI